MHLETPKEWQLIQYYFQLKNRLSFWHIDKTICINENIHIDCAND